MKIKVFVYKEIDGSYVADRPNKCGSPIVGRGKDIISAIGDLFFQAQGEFGIEFEFGKHGKRKKK